MQKLALVGSHPDTRDNAPYSDPAYDIWVFNEAAMANPTDTPDDPQKHWCKRWDVCFQMHKPEIYTSPYNRSNTGHWEWLQRDHGPRKTIYMQERDERVPNAVTYPLGQVKQLSGFSYFTSSFAYALALAIYQGYQEIELYGSDLTSNTEYQYQSEGLKAWIMFGLGKGVKITLKCWKTAFVAPLYGYEGEVQLGAGYYKERAAKHNSAWISADKNLRNVREAMEKYLAAGEWQKVQATILPYQKAAILCGNLAGAMSEAERYANYGERAIYRQEYEYGMARAQRDGEDRRVMMYHKGGMIEYVWNVVRQTGDPRAVKQLGEFIWDMGRHAYDTGALKGVYDENSVYMGLFDGLVQAAGGQKSLELLTGDK